MSTTEALTAEQHQANEEALLARIQAGEIFSRLVEEDDTYAGSDLEDKQVMALIAYLLRLGTDIAKPPPVETDDSVVAGITE